MREWALASCVILLTLAASRPVNAQAQSTVFSVVNAASYGTVIAPDSLAEVKKVGGIRDGE
jgi:hypothetical protein